MSTFPNSPRLLKGGIVVVDPESGSILRVITLQYNPDTVSRTLQLQSYTSTGGGAGSGDRGEALRLKGPPIETYKVEAELDATDALEVGDNTAGQLGIHPQLAVLEALCYPTSAQLIARNALSQAGTLEIAPIEAPLTLFVWSKNRIVPVRLTDFSVTEEAFDPLLNPIRAKVSLGLRVLNVDDLGFGHRGGSLYLAYQQQKEQLATQARAGTLAALGIGGLP
ncbi:MAG: hypothetical protein IPK16_14810 [Anaerolineales bacterium]|nr:hypothetical protein [Anaerolineales bacterium]